MGLFDFLGAGKREKFARQVAERLAERGWPHAVRYDDKSQRIDFGGDTFPFGLACLQQPFEQDARKDRLAALDPLLDFVFELPLEAPFEYAKGRLFPILRGRKVTELLAIHPSEDPRIALHNYFRPFTDLYVIQVASENPEGWLPLPALAYERWGKSFDEVLDVAMTNLRARPGLKFKWLEAGFYGSYADDENDLARLLLPECFDGVELRGAAVVAGVARNAVFVAGSEDSAGLEAMARYAPFYAAQQNLPIALSPLILEGGAWKPYREPGKLRALHDLHLLQQAQDYEQQYQLMGGRLLDEGRPPDLFPLKLYPADEQTVTLAFWRVTVGLLPKADFVVADLGDQVVVRPWQVAAELLGFTPEPRTVSPYFFPTKTLDEAGRAAFVQAPEPGWAKGKGFSFSGKGLNVFG